MKNMLFSNKTPMSGRRKFQQTLADCNNRSRDRSTMNAILFVPHIAHNGMRWRAAASIDSHQRNSHKLSVPILSGIAVRPESSPLQPATSGRQFLPR